MRTTNIQLDESIIKINVLDLRRRSFAHCDADGNDVVCVLVKVTTKRENRVLSMLELSFALAQEQPITMMTSLVKIINLKSHISRKFVVVVIRCHGIVDPI